METIIDIDKFKNLFNELLDNLNNNTKILEILRNKNLQLNDVYYIISLLNDINSNINDIKKTVNNKLEQTTSQTNNVNNDNVKKEEIINDEKESTNTKDKPKEPLNNDQNKTKNKSFSDVAQTKLSWADEAEEEDKKNKEKLDKIKEIQLYELSQLKVVPQIIKKIPDAIFFEFQTNNVIWDMKIQKYENGIARFSLNPKGVNDTSVTQAVIHDQNIHVIGLIYNNEINFYNINFSRQTIQYTLKDNSKKYLTYSYIKYSDTNKNVKKSNYDKYF